MSDAVRVAVRVRPFNSREKDLKAKLIIGMEGTTTTITDPSTDQPRAFTFDFSYWSHDGFVEDSNGICVPSPGEEKYASQQKVFDDIGRSILDNAFAGYNCSLFAYGQTGSGKSYSMVGYGPNRGIIPICCEEMCKRVESSTEAAVHYQISVSMLEIYNECVRDLLTAKQPKQGGLKVRSKPGLGNYVEGLSVVPVRNYADISARMDEGTKNRTVASTKMNNTSSRAHTVFTILFTTVRTSPSGEKNEITSKINLVDLAGSERADSTGATGDRLKEGSAINQSLSALGNVISALAEQSNGKKKVFVPYRNSVLTRLLQDALGGNSKTIMIAALSPADVNFDETLSTLRYADRAKQIKNNVTKNENPTDRIIRELKEENERLMKLIEKGGGGGSAGGAGAADSEETEKLRRQLEEQMHDNQRLMEEMQKSWEQKLKEAMERAEDDGPLSVGTAKASQLPYIINLHEDPLLSECVVYVFKAGVTRIGRADADQPQDIVLSGLNIKKEHAAVSNEGSNVVNITPIENSKTFINGELVTHTTLLHHNDRVIIGNNFVFRFQDPSSSGGSGSSGSSSSSSSNNSDASGAGSGSNDSSTVTWAKAMEELAIKQGMRVQQDLDGRMNKLDLEEAEKRKELEEKLCRMEEMMQKERAKAQAELEQQRSMFEARAMSGDMITEEEKAYLQQQEEEFQRKQQNFSEELQQRREQSQRLIDQSLKRKRENKQVETDLVALMPLISECNSMAEELGKPVRFEARLTVSAPKRSLADPTATVAAPSELEGENISKKTEITIRVSNIHDDAVWTWNTAKFHNRLFMMREMYQDFQANGARVVPPAQDPFWDPPEPFEIGKSYVFLKPLSQLVEIDSDFAIVDHKGQEQGSLRVEVQPQGENGEDLEYLQTSEELVGRPVSFLVRIPSATGLPLKYANDVYVIYRFLEQEFHTPTCEVKTQSPQFSYEARFHCPCATEEIRQHLLKEAIVFEVKGFTDMQSKAAQAALASPLPAAFVPRCEQCEEQNADVDCSDCGRVLCDACFALLHKSTKKQGHVAMRIDVTQQQQLQQQSYPYAVIPENGHNEADFLMNTPTEQPSSSAAVLCGQCEEQVAVLLCKNCDKTFCNECDALLHKSAKKQNHVKMPLPTSALATVTTMCSQCEEEAAVVKCQDCDRIFCTGCNDLLHKSAKKKEHQRQPLIWANSIN